MICPYNNSSVTTYEGWSQGSNNESSEGISKGGVVTRTVYTMMECAKENCGAWQGGKCCYNDN